MIEPTILDSHVHFWDPGSLPYPWLDEHPSLRRAFLPPQHAAATGPALVQRVVGTRPARGAHG